MYYLHRGTIFCFSTFCSCLPRDMDSKLPKIDLSSQRLAIRRSMPINSISINAVLWIEYVCVDCFFPHKRALKSRHQLNALFSVYSSGNEAGKTGYETLYIGKWKILFLFNVTECQIWFRMNIICKVVKYAESHMRLTSQILTVCISYNRKPYLVYKGKERNGMLIQKWRSCSKENHYRWDW
jgi:hypothetical protein